MSQLRIAPPSVPAGGPSTQRKIEKSGQAEDYRVLAECPSPGASVQTILVQFLGAYMHSLTNPNPIWSTAGSSSFEINKCTILAHMTSCRYRTKVVGTEQKPWQDSGLIRGKGSVSYQPVTVCLVTWSTSTMDNHIQPRTTIYNLLQPCLIIYNFIQPCTTM